MTYIARETVQNDEGFDLIVLYGTQAKQKTEMLFEEAKCIVLSKKDRTLA